jgi:hypothetical protein
LISHRYGGDRLLKARRKAAGNIVKGVSRNIVGDCTREAALAKSLGVHAATNTGFNLVTKD